MENFHPGATVACRDDAKPDNVTGPQRRVFVLDLSILELVILQLLVLVVSTAVGIVAFGFAMAMTPFFLIFLQPRLVVEMNIILTAVLFATVTAHSWRHIKTGTLAAMLLGGAVGIPLGVLLTKSLAGGTLSLTLTGVVIVTALLALLDRFPYFPKERAAATVVGGVFTLINSGLALGGPVVALFALNQGWSKDQTRAMLSTFFLVTGVAILATHASAGLMGLDELRSASIFVPSLLAGSLAASQLAGRVDEVLFRRLVIGVLLGTSFGLLGWELSKVF